MKTVEIDEKSLYQLFISDFRYSVRRDNHLAPSNCSSIIMEYLPKIESMDWRAHAAMQLTDEIIRERIFARGKLKHDNEWEDLLVFLIDYLDELPAFAKDYMDCLFNMPGINANIDYYSSEILSKIQKNRQ